MSLADHFENAADRLEDNYRGGRNLNRSSDEAQSLLQIGRQLDNFVYSRGRQFDGNVQNSWSHISFDLRFIADAYNLSYHGGGDNNRRNDDYRRNPRDRDDDNRSNNSRWGRFPFPLPN